MANISNDERNMIGLPVEGEDEEEEEEEEQEHTYNEANIPTETEPEAAEIIEQEQTITGYLPPTRDEQLKKLKF